MFPSSHATLTLTKIKTATNLANEAVNRWTPLPRLTKKLQFPDFRGTLKLDASKVDCDVASQPTSVSLANGNLRLVDWVGRMRVDSEHLKLQASATGSVRIGGPKGLEAAIAADLNLSPSTQGAAVVLKHPGGWSAFTGSIGRKFQTPSFEATLALGGGGSNDFIRLDSSASWSSSITLLDNNYITIKGVGSEAGATDVLSLAPPHWSHPLFSRIPTPMQASHLTSTLAKPRLTPWLVVVSVSCLVVSGRPLCGAEAYAKD